MIAKPHKSQRSVPASKRRGNVRGQFRLKKTIGQSGLSGLDRVILVDDVVTTGSTVTEVCRSIRGRKSTKGDRTLDIWVCAASVVV